MLNIYLCDDDENYLIQIKEMIEDFCREHKYDLRMTTFQESDRLEEQILVNNEKPDLLFLDIEMNECNGIDLAKRINKSCPSVQIAFLTNYISYATDVYETEHFYYVLKNEFSSRLTDILKRYHNMESRVFIESGRKKWNFDKKRIIYVERGRRCVFIHLEDMSEERLPVSFDQMIEKLTEPEFMRCHHSFLIGMNHIRCFQSEMITMSDGTEIPVSRTYRTSSREHFLKWQEIWT